MNRDNIIKFNYASKKEAKEVNKPLYVKSAAELFYNNSLKHENSPEFIKQLQDDDWTLFIKNRLVSYPRRIVATLVLYLIINLLGEHNVWFLLWTIITTLMQTIDVIIFKFVSKKEDYIKYIALISSSIIAAALAHNSYIFVLWYNYGQVSNNISSIILLLSWGVTTITLSARVQNIPKLYFAMLAANFFWPFVLFIIALFINYSSLNISWPVLAVACLIICVYIFSAISESYRNSIDRKNALLKALNNEELARRANDAKSYFISNLSHELRTPMNAILGSAQLLKSENNLSSKDKELISTMVSSGDSMVRLLNELLDNAKIEADKVDIEDINFSVSSLLNQVKSLWSLNAKNKKLEIALNIDENMPRALIGDKFRISQILNNFCSNSFKFTSSGTIEIGASYENGKFIAFVKDTGKGISEEELERLFVPFSQADSSITRLHGGTGLGLYNSLKLAKIMNGDISLESEKDKYTKFSLILPLEIGDDAEIEDDEDLEFSNNDIEMNILVADDNAASRLILNRYLEIAGANITMVHDGSAAVEQAKNKEYNVIFLDVRMPVLSGIEACKEIRKDSLNIDTPIIMISADAAGLDIMTGINAGANYYLSKPIDAKKLFKIIEISLNNFKKDEVIMN